MKLFKKMINICIKKKKKILLNKSHIVGYSKTNLILFIFSSFELSKFK